MPKFTISTPTYNRAHVLRRPFQSLLDQTYKDFEWLVIDDGSTGNTRELLERFCQEAPFSCRIFTQANSGKHVAFNRAVREAQGDLFINLDSDDELLPDALEKMVGVWSSLDSGVRAHLVGLTGLCLDQSGGIVGTRFPTDDLIMSSRELYFRYGDLGEKLGFQRTDILQKFPFPEASGLKFIAEGVIWFEISKLYKTLFVNIPFRRYRRDLTDLQALSVVRNYGDVAGARIDFYRCVLESEPKLIKISPLRGLKAAISYWRCQLHLRGRVYPKVQSWLGAILLVTGLPIGAILFSYDQLRKSAK